LSTTRRGDEPESSGSRTLREFHQKRKSKFVSLGPVAQARSTKREKTRGTAKKRGLGADREKRYLQQKTVEGKVLNSWITPWLAPRKAGEEIEKEHKNKYGKPGCRVELQLAQRAKRRKGKDEPTLSPCIVMPWGESWENLIGRSQIKNPAMKKES